MKRVKLKNGSLESWCRLNSGEGAALSLPCPHAAGPTRYCFPARARRGFCGWRFLAWLRLPVWEKKLSKFWRDKLRANRARDRRSFRRLRASLAVIRLWQHDVLRDLAACAERVTAAIEER